MEAEHDSQITVRQDIINVNEINEQGGIIEFAGDMTYKEFIDLNWVSDIDNSLNEDTGPFQSPLSVLPERRGFLPGIVRLWLIGDMPSYNFSNISKNKRQVKPESLILGNSTN